MLQSRSKIKPPKSPRVKVCRINTDGYPITKIQNELENNDMKFILEHFVFTVLQ